MTEKGQTGKFKDLRNKAEQKLRYEKIPIQQKKEDDVLKAIHELHVHQIELEMQNEQLRQTQTELEVSRGKYTNLFDFAPIGYFVLDKKGSISEANLTGTSLLGIERNFLVKRPFALCVSKEHRDSFYLNRKEVFRTGTCRRCDLKMLRKGKEGFFAELLIEPVTDSDGEVTHCRIAVIDITQRKKVEEELRKERNFSNAVLDTAGALVVILDKEGRITGFNRECEKITGYASTEVLGRIIWEFLIPKEDFDGVKKTWDSLQAGGFPNKHENHWLAKDGSKRLVAWTNTAITDSEGEIEFIIGTGLDITERREVEHAVLKSREDLARAQEVGKIGSWRLDTRKNILTWSVQNHRIFGIPKGTPMTYETFLSVVHPDDREYVDTKWKAGLAGEDYDIEHRIVVDGRVKWVREKAYLEFDRKGELLGGFGISQDITELKKAEEQINNLARFPEEDPFPVLRLSVNGTISYSNKPGRVLVEQWDRKIGQKAPKRWCDLVERASQSNRYLVEQVQCGDKIYSIAIAPVPKGGYVNLYGRDITVQRKYEKALRKSKEDLEMRVNKRTIELAETIDSLLFEISERKRAEKSLHEKTRDLDAFFSHTISPLVILDKDFNFIRVNKAYAKSCQRDISEFAGHNHFELYPNEENERIFKEVVRSKKPYTAVAKPFSFPDHPEWGVTYWDWTLVPVLNNERNVELLIFSLNDVTQRKRAEMAVAQSEEQYRSLVEVSPEAICVIVDEKVAFINSAAVKLMGSGNQDELAGRSVWDFIHADSIELARGDIRDLLEKKSKIPSREIKVVRIDGSTVEVETSATAILHQNKLGILVIFHDITERKRAEGRVRTTNALLELFTQKTTRKEYLDAVVEVIRNWSGCRCVGVRLTDSDGYIPYESYVGFSEDFMKLESSLCLNKDVCACIRVISQEPDPQDVRMMTAKGSFRCENTLSFVESLSEREKNRYRGSCLKYGFASVAVIPIRYRRNVLGGIHLADEERNKVPLETVQFLEDMAMLIGEAVHRFDIEQSLRQSESRLSEAQRIAHLGNWEWNIATGELWWSEEVYLIFDLSFEKFEATYESFLSCIHPDDRMYVEESVKEALYAAREYSIDYRIVRPDDSERNVHTQAEVVFDKSGNPVKMVGTLQDITERVKAEESARQSEEKFLLMAQSSEDVFWISTPGIKKMIYVSPAYEKLWGRTRRSIYLRAKSYLEAIHPEDKEIVMNELKDNTDGKWEFIYRIIRPDGSLRWVHDKGYPILNDRGKLYLTAGIFRDITELKHAEIEIVERQRELRSLTAELQLVEERERRQIAQDLHDSIGQILSFSSRELKTLKKSTPESIAQTLEEISNQLDEAVKQARTLSFDLSPSILYDLGFEVAVEDLIEKFSEERKISCSFENCQADKPLADHVSIFLYRSVRELLINVAKHAEADIIKVSLAKQGDELYISVEDNGVGFEVSEMLKGSKRPKGFGIFSIRERLDHIGGRFEIESARGEGTKVTLIAPLNINGRDR